jgi:hypothetical protein
MMPLGPRSSGPQLGVHGDRPARPWRDGLAFATVAAVVIGFLLWPVLLGATGVAYDWGSHMWLMWQQSRVIEQTHLPGLFIDSGTVFYPHFAFYGGTLEVVGALLAVPLGKVMTSFLAMSVLAYAATYGGWYWLGRMAGLGRWTAQAPGFLFVTSAYYLSEIYGRADFGELMAVSMIPLMLAAALHILRARRLSLLPALALAASTALFCGSHNLSLVLGSTVLALLAIAVALAVPEARRLITRAGVARVAAVVVPAALLNSWYLLPDLAYGKRTVLVNEFGYAHALHLSVRVVAAAHLFTFSRANADPFSTNLVVALPLLAIVWVIASLAMSSRPTARGPWWRAQLTFAGAALLIGLLMTHPSPLLIGPTPLSLMQFTYRLETYLLMALCAAVLAGLAVASQAGAGQAMAAGRAPARRSRSMLLWGMAPVLMVSAVGAIEQVDGYPHYEPLSAAFHAPWQGGRGNRDLDAYDDATLPLVNPRGVPKVAFSPAEALRREAAAIDVKLPAGQLVRTNLVGAPYFVSVAGAEVVGRDSEGSMVLRVGRATGAGGTRISLRAADNLPVLLGRVLTLLALVLLGLLLAWLAARALAKRARLPAGVSLGAPRERPWRQKVGV